MTTNPNYIAAAARADKLLEPDGSIQTHSGTVVSGPNASLAAAYSSASARADKLLQPDGSIITSGSGGGGATPPGGASGQVQYNNAGVFAGAPILTDGTNVAVGTSSVPANPLTVGAGANAYVSIIPPGGTYTGAVTIRPSGSGGQAYVYASAGTLQLSGSNGQYVVIGYPASSSGWQFSTNGGHVNFASFTGAASGSSPTIAAQGNDANVGMSIISKGTGNLFLRAMTTQGVVIATNPNNDGNLNIYCPTSAQAIIHDSNGIFLSTQGNTSVGYTGNSTYCAIFNGPGVNYFYVQGAVAGSGPTFSSVGADTNINLNIKPKGTGAVVCTGVVVTPSYTVATLPAPTAALQGARAMVTDATAPSFLGTLTGGGAVICPVFCNGTVWLAG